MLDAFAAQIALALERVHYVDIARDALVSMESERLRNSLLSAISHDLRTPLTTIVGFSSMLANGRAAASSGDAAAAQPPAAPAPLTEIVVRDEEDQRRGALIEDLLCGRSGKLHGVHFDGLRLKPFVDARLCIFEGPTLRVAPEGLGEAAPHEGPRPQRLVRGDIALRVLGAEVARPGG